MLGLTIQVHLAIIKPPHLSLHDPTPYIHIPVCIMAAMHGRWQEISIGMNENILFCLLNRMLIRRYQSEHRSI